MIACCYRLRRLMRRQPLPVFAECGFQAAVDFHRDIRLQADVLGQIVVRMVRRWSRGALLVELAIKLVASRRKWIEPGDAFEIDEVVGLLRVLQREFRGTAPAVRFRAEVGDLADGAAQEARHGAQEFSPRPRG